MKPRILVISHVLPFPGESGQQMRVQNTLKSLKLNFHVSFLSFCKKSEKHKNTELIKEFVNDQIFLTSIYNEFFLTKLVIYFISKVYSIFTGLKSSNFIIGIIEFSWSRIKNIIDKGSYDLILVEYFHSYHIAQKLKSYKIPVILDTHNILWKSFEKQQIDKNIYSKKLISHMVNRYKRYEEFSWSVFDYVIAINKNEMKYISSVVPNKTKILHAGMGVNIKKWKPNDKFDIMSVPKKIMFYGSLKSSHNQRDAMIAYENIFKELEKKHTNLEFWIVGSSPPIHILNLGKRLKNVIVTGFVKDIEKLLSQMYMAIIPWSGKYGFRSRLIEIMASGVPVLTSIDAIDGMDIVIDKGLFICETQNDFIEISTKLIMDEDFMISSRREARMQIIDNWDLESSYGTLSEKLFKISS